MGISKESELYSNIEARLKEKYSSNQDLLKFNIKRLEELSKNYTGSERVLKNICDVCNDFDIFENVPNLILDSYKLSTKQELLDIEAGEQDKLGRTSHGMVTTRYLFNYKDKRNPQSKILPLGFPSLNKLC